jgi:hypothetical protein
MLPWYETLCFALLGLTDSVKDDTNMEYLPGDDCYLIAMMKITSENLKIKFQMKHMDNLDLDPREEETLCPRLLDR